MTHNLCPAKVFHARHFPKKNSFLYRVFYLLLDLDELEKKSRFLSFEKFNLFSFYSKDHCKHDLEGFTGNPKNWIQSILAKENIEAKKVMLLCHPRILGYVFNPVSFWFCLDEKEKLIAVLAEVQNTFGEAHSYLVYNLDGSPIDRSQEHFAKKEFHVSPFFERKGNYHFKYNAIYEIIVKSSEIYIINKSTIEYIIWKNKKLYLLSTPITSFQFSTMIAAEMHELQDI